MTQTAPLPPQDLAAEEHVLGAMILSRQAIIDCAEILQPGDFYRASHGRLFQAIVDLDLRDQPVDVITLCDYLDETGQLEQVADQHAGGRSRVVEIANLVPSVGNAPHHARIIREMAQLRGLIRAGHELARMGYERPGELPDLVEQAEKLVLDLAQRRDQGELEHVAESMSETVRLMDEMKHHDITGLSTGLRDLDELTAGLQPGNLIVVAARPSMGKSSLALGIAGHVAAGGRPAAVFSLEMSKVEVNQRLLSHRVGLSLPLLRKPKGMTPDHWAHVTTAHAEISKWPLFIDDSGDLRITELRSRARRLKARQPDLALIVVDYLQLMGSDSRIENRVQEVSQISRGLKVLARDLEVPVVALSQLNRGLENRIDKRPMLSDLRESGAIEQDADLVVFVYRDEVYHKETSEPGVAELIVAKHRNGPTDTIRATWLKRTARFTDA